MENGRPPPGSFASFLLLKVYQICRDNREIIEDTIYFYLQMVILRIVFVRLMNKMEKKREEFFETHRSIRGTKISLALPFFLFQTRRKNSNSKSVRVHTCPRDEGKKCKFRCGGSTPRRGPGCTLSALYKCNMIIYPWKYTIAK